MFVRLPDIAISKKGKRTNHKMDFAGSVVQLLKLKEGEKYLNLASEPKILRNMKVMAIPILIDTLGTIMKGLAQGLEDFEIRGPVENI